MSSPRTLVHSARLVTAHEVVPDTWILFENGQVADRGTGSDWQVSARNETIVTDAAGRVLVPGFIDLHCHGGGGAAMEHGAAAIRTALDVHTSHGTTRSMVSLVSAPVDRLCEQLTTVARVAAADPRVLGAHLEGPFLDAGFRGAHDPAHLRDPDATAIDTLLEVAPSVLRMVTLAPERRGAMAAIRRLTDDGVTVALGHTGADYDIASAAIDAGASMLTHAFNGMRGLHHRAPGPVAAAMRAPHVTLEIIADGVHVHPEMVRLAFSSAPGRIALVTDAMAAAGAGDGHYRLGTVEVEVADAVARLAGGGSIAGSTLTQDDALRRTVRDSGIPLNAAVRALTATPAAAIGRAHELGDLRVGFAADAVMLTDALAVEAVWAAGDRVV